MMYISFVPLHAMIASTTYRIGLRYRSLNNTMHSYASVGKDINCVSNFAKWHTLHLANGKAIMLLKQNLIMQFLSRFSHFAWRLLSLVSIHTRILTAVNVSTVNRTAYFRVNSKNLEEVVIRFTNIHETLGTVTSNVAKWVKFDGQLYRVVCCVLQSKAKQKNYIFTIYRNCHSNFQWIWNIGNHLIGFVFISFGYHNLSPIHGNSWWQCQFFRFISFEWWFFTHLVYFKFFQDIFFITLQTVWAIFHLIRLAMVIEPCHILSVEVNYWKAYWLLFTILFLKKSIYFVNRQEKL